MDRALAAAAAGVPEDLILEDLREAMRRLGEITGVFDDEAVSRAIGLPTGMEPVAMLPIGYAGEEPMPTARRPLDDLVHGLKTGGG